MRVGRVGTVGVRVLPLIKDCQSDLSYWKVIAGSHIQSITDGSEVKEGSETPTREEEGGGRRQGGEKGGWIGLGPSQVVYLAII